MYRTYAYGDMFEQKFRSGDNNQGPMYSVQCTVCVWCVCVYL